MENVNELLFFVQNKLHATTKDAIVKMCVTFYSLEEIQNAVSCLESALSIQLSKRNKSDNLQSKLVTDIYNKLWSLDASSTQILFLAADLSRVPREKESSESLASTEQMLASIHSLKTIVSHLQAKMVTREILDASLSRIASSPSAASCASSSTHDSNVSRKSPLPPPPPPPAATPGTLQLPPSLGAPPLSPSAPPASQEDMLTGVSFASAVTTDAASAAGSASVTLSRQQRQDVAQRHS